MAKLIINTNAPGDLISVGKAANDRSGDPLRTAFTKVNDAIDKIDSNFTELYNAIGADVQIPSQANNDGKFLTTNGTTLSWALVSTNGADVQIPSQANNDGKFLTTNGTTLSWALVSTNGADTANTGFIDDRIYNINGVIVSNDDLVHGATARLTLPAYGVTDPVSLLNYYGGLSITAGTSPGSTKSWTFGSAGTLTFPALGTINNTVLSEPGNTTVTLVPSNLGQLVSTITIEKSAPPNTEWAAIQVGWTITIDLITQTVTNVFGDITTLSIELDGPISLPNTGSITFSAAGVNITKLEITPEGTTTWTFDSNGIIKLPANGDIVDSTGASVLGAPVVIDGGDASTTF